MSILSPNDRRAWSRQGLHVIAKPIGPICNLDCRYCFYLKKDSLYPGETQWRMPDETLELYIRQYIEAQPDDAPEIDFAWQGGEPTLLGIEFFERAVELQNKHARPGMGIHNSLQTNGVRLDDRWCEFLKVNRFLVGLSIDGPAELHDRYRRDKQGRGTQVRVLDALRLMRKHGVEFNALTCVNRHNGEHPVGVYRFLRNEGVDFIQFIPIVERLEKPGSSALDATPEDMVTDRSVLPEQFGRFLIDVFEEWVHRDVGRMFVRDFDQALAAWSAAAPTLCVFAPHCGRAAAIEHNGDLYSCDHFVERPYWLGNIHDRPIVELANSGQQERFGRDKEDTLPGYCRGCEVLFACRGACPKDRFLHAPDGEAGLNYLCAGYKMFFGHIAPVMEAMAAELRAGRAPANVMHRLRAEVERARAEAADAGQPLRRNAPCPCGSGKKYKNCCMRR